MSSSILSVAVPPPEHGKEHLENLQGFPGDFEPLRSEQLAKMNVDSSPIFRNPYMSPLLAPDHMLKGLPPIHIVVRDTVARFCDFPPSFTIIVKLYANKIFNNI